MQYISLHDCRERLFDLAIAFDVSENTPSFERNKKGTSELEGILERVQGPWYPGIFTKAAYLFVAINKGHVFINGNKRLALIITLDFLYRNRCKHKRIKQEAYRHWFREEFPGYTLVKRQFKTMYGWAFYNLSKAIASTIEYDFDTLKQKIEKFLRFSMRVAK